MSPEIEIRQAYGEALVELGAREERLVVLDADVSKSTRSALFAERFPHRFFNFGVAEANMVCAAAGFAGVGLIPVVNSFAFLLTMRALEQVNAQVAYPKANVKLAAAYA